MAAPDCLVVCEMEQYLRGRALGEIPQLISQHAINSGMQADQIIPAKSPLEGAMKAMDWARKGDVLLILSLTEREQVLELIKNYQ